MLNVIWCLFLATLFVCCLISMVLGFIWIWVQMIKLINEVDMHKKDKYGV